jgi:phosphopantothenoylcysteine decarboxylase/phosphopantothenate--cysteine ligase
MAREVGKLIPNADILIMAAAPADYRPAKVAASKIKKGKGAPKLDLEETTDILRSTIGKRKKGAIVVGFALETDDVLQNGRAKLRDKSLDLVVVNDATEPGAGFGVATNRVTLIDRDGVTEELPLMTKPEVADAILDRVERMSRGR